MSKVEEIINEFKELSYKEQSQVFKKIKKTHFVEWAKKVRKGIPNIDMSDKEIMKEVNAVRNARKRKSSN